MSSTAHATPLAVVGRQPIYDRRLRVHGYELLFRLDAEADRAVVSDDESCTARVVVNTFVDIGLENVVGSALAFINVNRPFVLSEYVRNLPAERVVLEILEDTPPDAEVLATLRELKDAGYRMALDDFVYRPQLEPFLALASIAKIDLSLTNRTDMATEIARLKDAGLLVVAERVETRADLDFCRDAGFDYFQGYFLAKPATLQRQRAPRGDRLAALNILALLNDSNASVEQLETAISRDVTLSYRLLRVINSAAFGMLGRIESLRQAIVHLGRTRIRSWVSLLVLSGLSDKPPELLTTGLVRARMCELLAEHVDPGQTSAYFTTGLFSVLDAILDTPMEQLVTSLPLSPAIGQALVDRAGRLGEVLDITMAYERCEWAEISCDGLTLADVRDAYLEAVHWALPLRESVAG